MIYRPSFKEIVETIAQTGKFYEYGQVLGHGKAYTINSALRLGYDVDDALRVILDEGFRTVEPLEHPVQVYRAVCGGKADNSIEFINKLVKAKKGDTFIDKGYSYASFSERGISPCNGIYDSGTPELTLTINVPKGARVSDGFDFVQNELLFPRNAEYKVIEEATRPNPKDYPNLWEMTISYILPKA